MSDAHQIHRLSNPCELDLETGAGGVVGRAKSGYSINSAIILAADL
jgi:hypothetical protein